MQLVDRETLIQALNKSLEVNKRLAQEFIDAAQSEKDRAKIMSYMVVANGIKISIDVAYKRLLELYIEY